MPKRRRLLTPGKKHKSIAKEHESTKFLNTPEKEVESTPRGRLKGALLDVLEPAADESDASYEPSPVKRERRDYASEDDDKYNQTSLPRQSYVLKLFDRSVDLSQFNEDSPLYPICRAWITNQPKANYKEFGKKPESPLKNEESIELPGPEGPPISRIPSFIPEQMHRSKDNINLNYWEAPPPSRKQLLESHAVRWAAVRNAWLEQGSRVEARYAATQRVLNKINVNAM